MRFIACFSVHVFSRCRREHAFLDAGRSRRDIRMHLGRSGLVDRVSERMLTRCSTPKKGGPVADGLSFTSLCLFLPFLLPRRSTGDRTNRSLGPPGGRTRGVPTGEIKKLMGGVLWGRATYTWCRDLCLHHRDIVPLANGHCVVLNLCLTRSTKAARSFSLFSYHPLPSPPSPGAYTFLSQRYVLFSSSSSLAQ